MQIEKYSIGIGDRFGKEGLAQLRALQKAEQQGARVVPVWNKSFREHSIIGTKPDDVRLEADQAVRAAGWKHGYHVDADHIGVKTVDGFLAASDFFTTEVSVDEAMEPQLPFELFFILAALAREGVPVQTIAPKFSGKFLKGIEYVGDPATFEREFDADLAVVAHARSVFGLPAALKISVHTGSDKFLLYPIIRRALQKHGAGLHLKTAGTTWLEEVIGVAMSGPRGLAVAKRIYADAFARFEELRKPYATVVEIDTARLPAPAEAEGWTADELVARLRHDQTNPSYNIHLRQLVHVAFRVAAEMGPEWHGALDAAQEIAG